MRILLTGSRGFVGARIREALPVLESPSLRNYGQEEISRLIAETRPDAIIHTAAISDIGACDAQPEASWHANVDVPVFIARAAKGCKLVLFSSDQVYGGCAASGPFREEDAAPQNLYAREKLEMERRVLEIAPDAVMLRTTWMYDAPLYGVPNRHNLLTLLLRAALRGESLSYSRSEYRGITYAREVAENMGKTLELPGGAYNFGSENVLSMYDTVSTIVQDWQLPAEIKEDTRPRRNLWMDCGKLRAQGIGFSDTAQGFKRCIEDYSLSILTI